MVNGEVDMIKVSVVVPVYNTSKYLNKCIESLSNQTLKEIEIIILNDGSTDGSEEIILNWINKDRRIRYYKHNNMGLGETRNKGINLANGKYISFIDSDDFVDNTMLEKMYKIAIDTESDVVCCGTYLYNDDNNKEVRRKFKNTTIDIKGDLYNFFKKYYFTRIYTYNAWDKIYKTDVLKDNLIEFGDNKKIFAEDNYFQMRLIPYLNRVTLYNEPLYYYYLRNNSIMNTYKKDIMKRNLVMIDELYRYLENLDGKKIIKEVLSLVAFNFIIESTINVVENKRKIKELKNDINEFRNSSYYNEFLEIITNKSYLLEVNSSKKILIIIIVRLLKLRLNYVAAILLYCIYKLKK